VSTLIADVRAELQRRSMLIGILLGLLLAVATYTAGQAAAEGIHWAQSHLQVVDDGHGRPVVIEQTP
jgi:uncharacterized membrane protein (UPF0136 family)